SGICAIVVVLLAGRIVGRRCGMVRRSSVCLSEAVPNGVVLSRIPVADRRRDSVCCGDALVGSGLESSISRGTVHRAYIRFRTAFHLSDNAVIRPSDRLHIACEAIAKHLPQSENGGNNKNQLTPATTLRCSMPM